MGSILVPGYLRWDGFKYVLDPTVEIVGPPGPPGPVTPGPPGPAGSPGPAGNAVLVWQPGGTATGNIYTSWTALMAARALVPHTPMTIVIDTSVQSFPSIDTGTWNFTSNTAVVSYLEGQQVPFNIPSGGTIQNPSMFKDLTVSAISMASASVTQTVTQIGLDLLNTTFGSAGVMTVTIFNGQINFYGSSSMVSASVNWIDGGNAGTVGFNLYDNSAIPNNLLHFTTASAFVNVNSYNASFNPSANTVTGVNGINAAFTGSGTPGNVLTITASPNVATWQTPSSFEPGGDLSGGSNTQTVIGIHGNPVSGVTPTAGQFLVENAPSPSGSAWTTLSGDVINSTTTSGMITVTGIQGNAVPTPSGVGTFLSWNGSALTWASGGGSNAINIDWSPGPSPIPIGPASTLVFAGWSVNPVAITGSSQVTATFKSYNTIYIHRNSDTGPLYSTPQEPTMNFDRGALVIDNSLNDSTDIYIDPLDNGTGKRTSSSRWMRQNPLFSHLNDYAPLSNTGILNVRDYQSSIAQAGQPMTTIGDYLYFIGYTAAVPTITPAKLYGINTYTGLALNGGNPIHSFTPNMSSAFGTAGNTYSTGIQDMVGVRCNVNQTLTGGAGNGAPVDLLFTSSPYYAELAYVNNNGSSYTQIYQTPSPPKTVIAPTSNGATLPQSTIWVADANPFPVSGGGPFQFTVASSTGIQTITYTGYTAFTANINYGALTSFTLPQSTIPFTFGSLPASGSVYINTSNGPQAVTYTGNSGGNLTGCSGGSGTILFAADAITIYSFTGCTGGTGTLTTGSVVAVSNGYGGGGNAYQSVCLGNPNNISYNISGTASGIIGGHGDLPYFASTVAGRIHIVDPGGNDYDVNWPQSSHTHIAVDDEAFLYTYGELVSGAFATVMKWKVETGGNTRIAAASNGVTLPLVNATINVGSTFGFQTYPGIIYVQTSTGNQAITVANATTTSFTGCYSIPGQTGTLSTGGFVGQAPVLKLWQFASLSSGMDAITGGIVVDGKYVWVLGRDLTLNGSANASNETVLMALDLINVTPINMPAQLLNNSQIVYEFTIGGPDGYADDGGFGLRRMVYDGQFIWIPSSVSYFVNTIGTIVQDILYKFDPRSREVVYTTPPFPATDQLHAYVWQPRGLAVTDGGQVYYSAVDDTVNPTTSFSIFTIGSNAPSTHLRSLTLDTPLTTGFQSGSLTLNTGTFTVNTGITINSTSTTRILLTLTSPSGSTLGDQYKVTGLVAGGPGTGAFTVTAINTSGATVTTDGSTLTFVIFG